MFFELQDVGYFIFKSYFVEVLAPWRRTSDAKTNFPYLVLTALPTLYSELSSVSFCEHATINKQMSIGSIFINFNGELTLFLFYKIYSKLTSISINQDNTLSYCDLITASSILETNTCAECSRSKFSMKGDCILRHISSTDTST